MRVCIVSDSHDRADPLAAAVREAKERGADVVVHCGDLIGTQTLRGALSVGLPLHLIHGNNIGDQVSLARWVRERNGQLEYHGADARLELGGKKVFAVHYPEYGFAMACTGEWDLVCCGHSHVAAIEQVANVKGGRTWLVNPGTVAGLAAPATWILGDLDAMRFEIFQLGAGSPAFARSIST
jgi:putative phosphoesterase